MSYSLPHLHVSGTNYEVGKSIGTEFKARINDFIRNYNDFNKSILPFIKTENGKKKLDDYSAIIKKQFPWYFDEIKGVSDGSEIEFDLILALNLSVELMRLIYLNSISSYNTKQCTDLYLIDDENNIILHNEDADPAIYETCYLVSVKIQSSDYDGIKSPEEEFTAYCYPGNLGGNAFGFNSSGFAFGVNTLYSTKVVENKIPHQILTRLMMSSKNLTDFEDKILNTPVAYGVSINLGFFGDDLKLLETNWHTEYKTNNLLKDSPQISSFNYEIVASDLNKNIVSKHCIVNQDLNVDSSYYSKRFYRHVNCYERIETDQIYSVSSSHRKSVIDSKRVESRKDLLDLASNDSDPEYPIFRTPRPTDQATTTAIAFFDLKLKFLEIFIKKAFLSDYKCFLKIKMD